MRRLSTIIEEMPTPKIESKKRSLFRSAESWDDFLDFSRMRIPSEGIIVKRLVENLLHFSGNYFWIWIVFTLAWGVLLNGRILASALILVFGAFAGKTFYIHASMAEASLKLKSHERKDDDVPDSAKVNTIRHGYAFM